LSDALQNVKLLRKTRRAADHASPHLDPGVAEERGRAATDYELGWYSVSPKDPRCDHGALQTANPFPIKRSARFDGVTDDLLLALERRTVHGFAQLAVYHPEAPNRHQGVVPQ